MRKLNVDSSKIISFFFFLSLASIITTAYFSYKLNESLDNNITLQKNRDNSIRIADELRNSSNDLTNFARLYTITRDTFYLSGYKRIIDIRNGESPRPAKGESSDWDYFISIKVLPSLTGESISMDSQMIDLGMCEEEIEYIKESKIQSDSLALIEYEVFNTIENSNNWRVIRRARERLFDKVYLGYKSKIMIPIERFHNHVNNRTSNSISESQKNAKYYLTFSIISSGITLIIILLLRFVIYLGNKKITNLLDNLNANNIAINKSNSVIEFCPDGVIITANDNFLDTMGYSLDEIKGKHHRIFVDKKESKSKGYLKFWNDLQNGEFKSGDFMRYKKDGEVVYIHGTYNPIKRNDEVVKILKIVTDVTEGVLQRHELDRKNSYLEHSAKILRHDMHSGINTYIPRGIRSLNRRLDGMLSETEKEKIKSPMKMLTEGLSHAQKVYEGVKEFTNLVKKDSTLSTEELDVKKCLGTFLRSTSYSKQVEISDLGVLKINESLFCTAVDNLIRNGLRYNDSESKLVKIYKENELVIVEDNGRGMSQKEFEELSKPYTRKKGNLESGSGLGLNICLAIMREHGFDLSVEKTKTGTKIKIKT